MAKSATIPDRFQGTWDADAKACQLSGSDMRYYIGADWMRFGDAVGKVRRVVPNNDISISVDTNFRSDGDPWKGEIRLDLSASGDELTIQTGRSRTMRHRCSALA